MVYFYYLKSKFVSPSKGEHYEDFWYSLEKMMFVSIKVKYIQSELSIYKFKKVT